MPNLAKGVTTFSKSTVDPSSQTITSNLINVEDKKALAIVRSVLKDIAAEIDATNDGRISLPGLGTFVVRQVKRKKESQEVVVKRVVLRRPKGLKRKNK